MNNKNIFILHSYITRYIKLSKIYRNNNKLQVGIVCVGP